MFFAEDYDGLIFIIMGNVCTDSIHKFFFLRREIGNW